MKESLQKYSANPKYLKAFEWARLITITGTTQTLVQVIGFVCGIVVLRLLPRQEYALYTLANTMLGTMTILADGGVSSSVMAQGGKIWQDKEKLGVVLATGLSLRKKFAAGSLIVSIPVLAYLLKSHGAGLLTIILIVIALVPAFLATLYDSLLEIIPRLHQNVGPLQKNQLSVSVGRLLLSALTLFIFPWTFIALLGNGIPRIYGNLQLRKIAFQFVSPHQKKDNAVEQAILKNVRRTLPENIYYCLSAQLTIWIISLFGTTMALADLGAITRLNVAFNLFSVLFVILIVPRFSRAQEIKQILYKYVFMILLACLFLSLIIMCTTWLLSEQLLWVLGNAYSELKTELLISVLGGCVFLFQSCFFLILVNKGWAINPVLYISISIISTIITIALIDVTSLRGVLIFNLIISFIQSLALIVHCFFKISRIKLA